MTRAWVGEAYVALMLRTFYYARMLDWGGPLDDAARHARFLGKQRVASFGCYAVPSGERGMYQAERDRAR